MKRSQRTPGRTLVGLLGVQSQDFGISENCFLFDHQQAGLFLTSTLMLSKRLLPGMWAV